jgi:hypothetical protein
MENKRKSNLTVMLEEATRRAEELREWLDGHPKSEYFLVGRDGVWIKEMGMSDADALVGFTVTSHPIDGKLFNLSTAMRIAYITGNGNGCFRAIGHVDASKEALESCEKAITIIKAILEAE